MNQPSKSASSHSISTSNSYAASHPSLNENDADNRTSARTSVPTPPPASTRSGGMYTFYWICPCSQCHTCTPRPQATRPLNRRYFDEFEDRVQLETERGLESIGANALPRCPTTCAARQVYTSREAKVVLEGKREWSYVLAKCGRCGRRAGRGGCLVKVERE